MRLLLGQRPASGRRTRIAVAGLATLVTAAACTQPVEQNVVKLGSEAEQIRVTAHVVVDAADDRGRLNNLADYQNQADHALKLVPSQEARVRQLKPKVVRGWVKPDLYYDHTTGTYDFDYVAASGNSFYDYMDQLSAQAPELMLNIGSCAAELMDVSRPDLCAQVLKTGIRHYKLRFPGLRYIELFNEPDKTWQPVKGESPAMSVDEYYQWYKIAYRIVNELNEQLQPAVPLRLGGPVTYTFNSQYLEEFIDAYAADPDPSKRLDFISYHQYQARSNPASVTSEKARIVQWLTNAGVDRDTPVFVTEYGVFPGGNSAGSLAEDVLTHTAAMSTLGGFYIESGTDMPMHWVYNHPTNDRKSMFVDGVDNAVTPYFNLVLMQRMLRKIRVSAHSDALSAEGLGVNALASRDDNAVAVLVTNYQWTTGQESHGVALRVVNLPPGLAGKQLRIRRYLVDHDHSNYFHNPRRSELEMVEEQTRTADGHVDMTFALAPNALSLVLITPVR